MNNRGVTLVELIVSITLISVVMLFIFRLMSDITFDKDNEYFASGNQIQRVEIISEIEDSLLNNTITEFTKNNNVMTFTFDNGLQKELKVTDSNTLSFNEKTWTLRSGYKYGDLICEGDTYYECTIEVYTQNKDNTENNNNTIDDITFSFKKE